MDVFTRHASGLIEFGRLAPTSSRFIVSGKANQVKARVAVLATHGKDGLFYIPGFRDATAEVDRKRAFDNFKTQLEKLMLQSK